MSNDLTPEQRAAGEANFKRATDHLGLTRRELLKASALGVGALGGSAAAVYFGYNAWKGDPVRAAIIGCGDEGGVLVGEHNPDFIKFVAACDIRPYNHKRIFEGDPDVSLRKGFKKIYGAHCDKPGPTSLNYVEYVTDYTKILERKDVEAVVIALPLHLHAKVAIEAMKAGKHVLCEKLMARNITECKEMIRTAKETNRILSIGHQRHYSLLYSQAVEVIKSGVLGDVKHIRALWHRNFSWPASFDPKKFAWAFGDKTGAEQLSEVETPTIRDGWFQPVLRGDYEGLEEIATKAGVDLREYLKKAGYDGLTAKEALTQLVRWRLYEKTGGGLMAELGSHQLDAASIFLGKVKPLSVSGTGTRAFFGKGRNPREIDDHVFVTYEFPGKNHPRGPNGGGDKDDVVVVTYSSISTNGFEPYGETLMGTRGTMHVEAEKVVRLYTENEPGKKKGDPKTMEIDVKTMKKDAAAAESSSTWGGPPSASSAVTATGGGGAAAAVSRGYREEMEDFAFCIRNWDAKAGYEKNADGSYKQRLPRCHGEVAMADAIVALSANIAMKEKRGQRLEFKPEWFDYTKDGVPEKS